MYNQSDMRRYFVPCPDCGHADLRWANIRWFDETHQQRLTAAKGGVMIPLQKGGWSSAGVAWTGKFNGSTLVSHLGGLQLQPESGVESVEVFRCKARCRAAEDMGQHDPWRGLGGRYPCKISGESLLQRAADEKYKQATPPAKFCC